MNNNITELKRLFNQIKQKGLIKSLRNGTTGCGYTFETLINKSEDQLPIPDFKDIEIKTIMGYSKRSITLFNCEPIRDDTIANNYIFEKYSYHKYNNLDNFKLFSRKIYKDTDYEYNDFKFKLKVDYLNEKIIMSSYKNDVFCEDICYWPFIVLEDKLNIKLKKLAIIEAYPYRRPDGLYYKYFKITFYTFTNFKNFLNLIDDNKIFVSFYLRDGVNKKGDFKIENHGVSFRIERKNLEKLFLKIK